MQLKKREESRDGFIGARLLSQSFFMPCGRSLPFERRVFFTYIFPEFFGMTSGCIYATLRCIGAEWLLKSENRKRFVLAHFVELKQVKKIYQMGEVTIPAVDGIDFEIEKGEFAVIVGPSGAGKTTVLNILGGMDTCTSGEVWVDGKDISGFKGKALTAYRRDDIGFVFQFYNLVQNLTALANVELALQICKDPLDAEQVLKEVGLEGRKGNFPAQLSGGEQQRVAIARALAKNPKLLLCDEPTGALDYNTGKAILKLLQDTCREKGMTIIVITHNQAIAPMADRVIKIKNGRVSRMEKNEAPVSVETIEW